MPVSDTMADKIRHAYAQFSKGDVDTFASLFSDGGVMFEADGLPYGGAYQGTDAVKSALLEIVSKWWTNLNFDLRDFLIGEQHVAAYGLLTAISRTSGQKVEFPLAEVWELAGDKVVSMTPIYFDTLIAAKAL